MPRSENGTLVGNLVEMRMVFFFSACLHCHFQGISMDELFPPRTIQSSTWGNHPTQALASSVVAIQGAEPSSTIRVCTIMLTSTVINPM